MSDKTQVIDLTEILRKKRTLDELTKGIPLDIGEEPINDFFYVLKGYLEDEMFFQVEFVLHEEKMYIHDPEGIPVCNLVFSDGRIVILYPDNYCGSSIEMQALGVGYQVISAFCHSWNEVRKPTDSID